MFINIETKEYPLSIHEVRKALPNISMPRQPKREFLNEHSFDYVEETERPEGDVVEEGEPELRDDGLYYQTFTTRSFTEEELTERRKREVPEHVGSYQARRALMEVGRLKEVNDYMKTLDPETSSTRLAWEKAGEFHRKSDVIAEAGETLNFTDKEIDELFILANTY